MPSFDEILGDLEKQTQISREELKERIDRKQKELSGLVSFEGAAHLIAKELGINLFEKTQRRLQINNLVSGMRNVNLVGRIFKISPVVEFEKSDKSKGKVVNIFLGDHSGYVRVPLWNEQVKMIEENLIRLGDAVQVSNGMAKENTFGDVEISIGKFGNISSVQNNELPDSENLLKKHFGSGSQKREISQLVPGNFEIRGTIVQLFKGNFIFSICPVCGSSVQENKCSEHGEATPAHALVVSCIVDDGTGDIRTVFFRNTAEKMIQANADQIHALEAEKRYEFVLERLAGKEIMVSGRVKKNNVTGRLEMIVNEIKDLNLFEESKILADEIEAMLN